MEEFAATDAADPFGRSEESLASIGLSGPRAAGLGERAEDRSERHGAGGHIAEVRECAAHIGRRALLVKPGLDEPDDRPGSLGRQPTGRPLARNHWRRSEGEDDLPESPAQRLEFFGELKPPAIQ